MKIIYSYQEAINALEKAANQFMPDDRKVTIEIEMPIKKTNTYQPIEYVNPNLRKLLQSFGYYKDENHRRLIDIARYYLNVDESNAIYAISHASCHMENILCISGEDAKLFLKAVKAHEINP